MKNTALPRIALALLIALAALLLPLDLSPRAFLLAGASLMALDVLLNGPWLPNLHLRCVEKHRHYLYTAVAASCIGALIPVSQSAPSSHLLTLFTLATAACVLAVVDTLKTD